MDVEFLYHVADVPLDGVGGDAETLGHGGRVQALREQVPDVERSRRELRNRGRCQGSVGQIRCLLCRRVPTRNARRILAVAGRSSSRTQYGTVQG
jgi:hypothetical protein